MSPDEFNPEPLDLEEKEREMQELQEGQGSIFGGMEAIEDEEPEDFEGGDEDSWDEDEDEDDDDFEDEDEDDSWEDDDWDEDEDEPWKG